MQVGKVCVEENRTLCEEFATLAHKATKEGNIYKARVYQTVCDGIRLYPAVITSGNQAQKIRGVGPFCSKQIDRILKTKSESQDSEGDLLGDTGHGQEDLPEDAPDSDRTSDKAPSDFASSSSSAKPNSKKRPADGQDVGDADGQGGSDNEGTAQKTKKPRVTHDTTLKQLIEAGHLSVGQELVFRKHDKSRGVDVAETGMLTSEGHISYRYSHY